MTARMVIASFALVAGLAACASACYSVLVLRKNQVLARGLRDDFLKAQTEAQALREVLEQMGCTVDLTWVDPETLRIHVQQRVPFDADPSFGKATTFGKSRTH
jgi:hypothetical protein